MDEKRNQQIGASQPYGQAEQGYEEVDFVSPPASNNQFEIQ